MPVDPEAFCPGRERVLIFIERLDESHQLPLLHAAADLFFRNSPLFKPLPQRANG
jgi:hypothetical protein